MNRQKKNIITVIFFIFLLLSTFFILNSWLKYELCKIENHTGEQLISMTAYTAGPVSTSDGIGIESSSQNPDKCVLGNDVGYDVQ